LTDTGKSTINRQANTSSEKVIYSKGSRPPKLSHRTRSLIIPKIITTTASLHREQNFDVSYNSTIKRTLRKTGLKGRKSEKKNVVKKEHYKKIIVGKK